MNSFFVQLQELPKISEIPRKHLSYQQPTFVKGVRFIDAWTHKYTTMQIEDKVFCLKVEMKKCRRENPFLLH